MKTDRQVVKVQTKVVVLYFPSGEEINFRVSKWPSRGGEVTVPRVFNHSGLKPNVRYDGRHIRIGMRLPDRREPWHGIVWRWYNATFV